jgi:hypothetical protein
MAFPALSSRSSRAPADDTTNINDSASSRPNARAFHFRILSLDVMGEDEDVVTRQYNLVRPKALLRKVASTVGQLTARMSQSFVGLRKPSPYEVSMRCDLVVPPLLSYCVGQLMCMWRHCSSVATTCTVCLCATPSNYHSSVCCWMQMYN